MPNILGLNLDVGPIIPRGIGAAGVAVAGAYADTRFNPILPGRLSNSEVLKIAAIGADVLGLQRDGTYWGKALDGAADYGLGSFAETYAAGHFAATAPPPPPSAGGATTVARAATVAPMTIATQPGQGVPSAAGAQFEQATSGL